MILLIQPEHTPHQNTECRYIKPICHTATDNGENGEWQWHKYYFNSDVER